MVNFVTHKYSKEGLNNQMSKKQRESCYFFTYGCSLVLALCRGFGLDLHTK